MQLQIFNHNGFEIRGGIIDNSPYFVAMDIAKALEYSESAMMLRRLDEDEIIKIAPAKMADTNFSPMAREITLINESGLYNAILGSKKPQAKAFKKWVTSEVLPSIRKHGFYAKETQENIAQRNRQESGFIQGCNTDELDLKQEHILQSLITELQDSNTLKDSVKQENENLKNEIIALQRKLLSFYEDTGFTSKQTDTLKYRQRLSENEKRRILMLRKEGKSLREIGRLVQRNKSTVHNVIRG